jgi:hypothetical protein
LNQQLIGFAFGIFFGRLNAAIKLRLCGVNLALPLAMI